MNRRIRVMRGGFQTLDQIGVRVARRVALANQHLPHRIDGHATGDVAGEGTAHTVRDDEDESSIAEIEMRQVFGWGSSAIGAGPGLLGREIEHQEIVFVTTSNSANV